MKITDFVVFMMLLAIIISPFNTSAQTSTSSTQLYREGSEEPISTRRERVRGYRRQSSELRQKIDALGSTANQNVLIPVLFGVGTKNIFPNFGDPRSGGRTHEGEDIMAVKGTPIVSPTPAVVLRTGVGATEGNYVYTANPGGETFVYMHLDRIGEGVTSGLVLGQGSLIGYVGNTGNASGGAAHLHFEIHGSSGGPMDPFPRLTGEFSLSEKMTYVSQILSQTTDSATLSLFLVSNFRSTFNSAVSAGITLHPLITASLASAGVSSFEATRSDDLPPGDLEIGSSGTLVVELQKYLIQANSGPSAMSLASAGATGNFGPITEKALIEYQNAVGITPPSGYYGPTTRTYIASHPLASSPSTTPTSPTPTNGTSASLTRNLYKNIVGEDVRTLQKLLNTNGYTVALSGSGSLGNETTYFGPATESAVIKFQVAKGITPAVGYVGPITRTALSSL